jgi:hypothetical protein
MILFQLRIVNPFSDRWNTIFYKDHQISKNKAGEIQICKDTTIVRLSINVSTHSDYAGVHFEIGLFGYSIMLHFYDTRRWNYEENRWYNHGEVDWAEIAGKNN